MPTYEYQCQSCGLTTEVFQIWKDDKLSPVMDRECICHANNWKLKFPRNTSFIINGYCHHNAYPKKTKSILNI